MAEVYSKNYYAWLHRLWLLQHMDAHQLLHEIGAMKQWLQSHVSDHCASSHRQQAILKLLSRYSEGIDTSDDDVMFEYFTRQVEVLEGSLGSAAELISSRAGYETLWYHKRALADLLLERVSTFFPTAWTAIARETVGGDCSPSLIDELHVDVPPATEQMAPQGSAGVSLITFLLQLRSNSSSDATDAVKYSSLAACVRAWLVEWLLNEAWFCRSNAHGDVLSWDPTKQRQLALRYWCYLLERIVRRLGDSLLEGHVSSIPGSSTPSSILGSNRAIHPAQTAVHIPTRKLNEIRGAVGQAAGDCTLLKTLLQALNHISNVLAQEGQSVYIAVSYDA
jgi:hypothetical protein